MKIGFPRNIACLSVLIMVSQISCSEATSSGEHQQYEISNIEITPRYPDHSGRVFVISVRDNGLHYGMYHVGGEPIAEMAKVSQQDLFDRFSKKALRCPEDQVNIFHNDDELSNSTQSETFRRLINGLEDIDCSNYVLIEY